MGVLLWWAMCDHFARELIKVAVVQICQEAGFQSIQSSALESLSDILISDLEERGYGTHLYAESSCRTDANFLDLSLALRDCNSSIKELIEYSNQVDEKPFAKPIPPFPIRADEVKSERPDYVPSYLPPFPGKHTYIFTPTYEETTAEPGKIRKLKNKRKRQVESSLAQLDAHVHATKAPKKVEAPDYFSVSNSNTFINSLGLQAPAQIKNKIYVKHRKYQDEVNAANEGDRPQKILTQQDDGAEAKRKEKYEKILAGKLQNSDVTSAEN